MINHHPSTAVLSAFSQAELEDSIAIIVACHVQMCEVCQQKVASLTEKAANQVFEDDTFTSLDNVDFNDLQLDTMAALNLSPLDQDETSFDIDLPVNMIDEITAISETGLDFDTLEEDGLTPTKNLSHKDGEITLPRALNSIEVLPWQGLGKISRARFGFDDDERRLSLLKIDQGGQIPQHTHTGIEITLLLEGSFEDDMGTYQVGDFIWLDAKHTHSPITQEGCICLTLVSDALHFTQGFTKLLNPLGKLIY